jgi:hypothetical protein
MIVFSNEFTNINSNIGSTQPITENFNISDAILFSAKVVEVYTVNNTAFLDTPKGPMYGIFVSNFLCNLMGVNQTYYPEIGSDVLCIKTRTNDVETVYIIGTHSISSKNDITFQDTHKVGSDTSQAYSGLKEQGLSEKAEKTNDAAHGSEPTDIVPGEYLLQNSHGSALALLNGLAQLKANDLAKVECFILDDLVRILSMQYQHLSAFGEFKILNNEGAINVVWKGTSNENELWGTASSTEKKEDFEMSGDNQIKAEFDPNKDFTDIAKHRFQEYIGKLGSFVHRFITDPIQTEVAESPESFASGRYHRVVNLDGSVLTQSTGDIVFEHVSVIPVPVFKGKIEELDFAKSKLNYYDSWEPNGDLFECSFQLRDYSRWFSFYYSLAGFLALKEEGKVILPESLSKITNPLPNMGEEKIKPDTKYSESQKLYSTIRLFKDGSIVLLDGYGNTIHMTGPSINIDGGKDVNITAAENINMIAKNVNVIARDEIDLTAANRGINLKSEKWLQLYCKAGPMLLQSDYVYDKDTDGDTFFDKLKSEVKDNSIILKTLSGNILLTGTVGATLVDTPIYINHATASTFTGNNFAIKDSLLVKSNAELLVNTPISAFKTIQAENIQAVKTTPVITTGQTGLINENKDINKYTKDEYESTIIESVKYYAISEETLIKLAEGESINMEYNFSYIPEDDKLIPKYNTIYQSIAQNFCRTSVAIPYDDFPMNQLYSKDAYGPMYPGIKRNYKIYSPTVTTQGIDGKDSKSLESYAPSKAMGKFIDTTPTYWFKK